MLTRYRSYVLLRIGPNYLGFSWKYRVVVWITDYSVKPLLGQLSDYIPSPGG